MGIMWAAFACLLICWLLIFAGTISNSYKKHIARVKAEQGQYSQPTHGPAGDESSFTRAAPPTKDEETQAVLDSSKSKETKKFPMMNQYN